jgi:TonB family protein
VMAAGVQIPTWDGVSRRRVPRFPLQAALDVTVLRSGIPDTVPGRSVNVCECGIAAMLADELVPGEAVAVEVQLAWVTAPLRTRAMVRHQDKLCCGLEFVGPSTDQRAAIRTWAKDSKAEAETETGPELQAVIEAGMEEKIIASRGSAIAKSVEVRRASGQLSGGGLPRKPGKKRIGIRWDVVLVLAVIAGAVFWWRWNRGWNELESGLQSTGMASGERLEAQVPAEVMQKLLIHRVEPAYPAEARKANLQGIIALDIVVGRDGSVVGIHALNGPEVLARAAADALRWWKFDPYRVNGQPAVVKTTVAVEFKK